MKFTESDWEQVFLKSYGTPKLNIVKGQGINLTADNGRKYLDFIGGIATNVLGHSHPAVIKAVKDRKSTRLNSSHT